MIIDGPGIDLMDGGLGIDTFRRDWTGLNGTEFILDLNFILGLQGAVGFPPDGADQFTGIENYTCTGLIGGIFTGNDVDNAIRTDMGVDTLIGNGGDDYLSSGGARDRLWGGRGDDTLTGGFDRDVLTGGAGNDQFVFQFPSVGDRITDFSSNTPGNNDAFYFDGRFFPGPLASGTLDRELFVSRGDNQAQELDDRFIFDTSDQTLWYDGNGSLQGGKVLLADLQPWATMTFRDIIIF